MNKLIYYAGLYTASAGLLKLAGFILFIWLAKTLPVAGYANFGLLYSLQTGITSFGLVGIVEAVVGLLKSNRTAEEQRNLYAAANNAFLVTLGSALVFALLLFVFFINRTEISFLTFFWVLVSGALVAYSSLQAQITRLEEKHHSSLCFSFILPLAGLVGSFFVFFIERTLQSFFFGSVIGLVVASAGLFISRIGFYGIAERMVETRLILLRITPFITVAVLGWLGGYGNNYVINFLFENKEVAKFTFALSMSSIMQLVATALNQVWSPRFFQLIHELPPEQVEKKNRRFFRLQGLAMGIIGGMVIALFPVAMKTLGGNLSSYRSMNIELLCLFSAYVFLSPWWHCNNYLLAHDNGSTIMRISIVTSIIGIAVWLVLMRTLGSIGIYIGFMTQMIIRSIGMFLSVKKRWPVKMSWEGIVFGLIMLLIGFGLSNI